MSLGNDVFVSDASIWEVAVKSVARPDELLCDTVQLLSKCKESGYRFLPIFHDAIIAYGGLPGSAKSKCARTPLLLDFGSGFSGEPQLERKKPAFAKEKRG